jgi:hypothetical protein
MRALCGDAHGGVLGDVMDEVIEVTPEPFAGGTMHDRPGALQPLDDEVRHAFAREAADLSARLGAIIDQAGNPSSSMTTRRRIDRAGHPARLRCAEVFVGCRRSRRCLRQGTPGPSRASGQRRSRGTGR